MPKIESGGLFLTVFKKKNFSSFRTDLVNNLEKKNLQKI